jgi:cyclic beta-1,2-glucan synthetase
MAQGREGGPGPIPHRKTSSALILIAALGTVTFGRGTVTRGADDLIRLSEAAEQGAFNVGAARATVARERGPGGEVLKLDFTIPPGSAAGAFTKSFPGPLDAEHIDLVQIGVKSLGTQTSRQIAAAMEIKGTAGVQRIPLAVQPEWRPSEEMVDWNAVGTLREVVLSVSHAGDGGPATGTILIDGRFERLSPIRKLGMLPWARLAGVLLVSLLMASLIGSLHAMTRWWPGDESGDRGPEASVVLPPPRLSWSRDLRSDLVRGGGTVFVILLALAVFLLGEQKPLDAGWMALGMALAGVAVAEWWKYGLTGIHLTAQEVFQDSLVSGLLAVSASPLAILQPPASWGDLLLLSQTVATVATLVYHAANASCIASSGRHLGAASAALIAGTPYVFGNLVLLESGSLLSALGNGFTAGALTLFPAGAESLGRVIVLFVFNEAVAGGLGLATRGKLLKSPTAHLAMMAVTVAAVAAPWVAALGSGAVMASWSVAQRWGPTVLTTMLSQAGLWAEAYLITGMAMDAIHGEAPSRESVFRHPVQGIKKGMVYSGVFMGSLYTLGALWEVPLVRWLVEAFPVLATTLLGALIFPLLKTIIESFDGSPPFFRRALRNYRDPLLYLRGAVVGAGVGYGLIFGLPSRGLPSRAWFGFGVGALGYAGIDILRDIIESARDRGQVQRPRYYFTHALLGGFIGAAIGFYLDDSQVSVVVAKFHRYLAAGQAPQLFDIYPLVSKWGHLNLGVVTGGVDLLFVESLAGVISWSTAAWLFAINRTFMRAYFWKDATPIRELLTKTGMTQLAENMIQVLRWGLWMSPIINSFLRPMGTPTWYNQDGAVRTVLAIFRDATLSPDAFRAWSLQVFVYLLAYDAVRILIWLDHMGLRVATLVNLSFLGMDKLEQRLARFVAPAATARCIPEGVKRFTTWGPLLIPFYIPRGRDWDQAWSTAEVIQGHGSGGLLATILGLSSAEKLLLLGGSIIGCAAVFAFIRRLSGHSASRSLAALSIGGPEYEVWLREDGELVSRVSTRDYDISRRSYDLIDPAGRTLFLMDTPDAWPIIGNFPGERDEASSFERNGNALAIRNSSHGLRTTVEITLPKAGDPVELWTIAVENLTETVRSIKLVPYLEWVLNRPESDRGHTQYNRLFAEMEYIAGAHALLAWDKHAKAMGILASDRKPEGFLTSRIDFIGRARSVWKPRVLETLAFSEARDTPAHATLDPIGCLLIGMPVPARGSARMRLLIGLAENRSQAIDLIADHLQIPLSTAKVSVALPKQESIHPIHPIGHGEVPPEASRPYFEFSEDGRRIFVRTPFTPRPFDHTMSNALGHVLTVTNRGLHTTSSVNSQQNRLTPDWSDIVTREVPGEAFYLYDPEAKVWFSPTYQPLNDPDAVYEVEYGVDGTAVFRMAKDSLETDLTLFVPPGEPLGVYLLTVRNHATRSRRLRLAPYFQIVLAGQPEHSGPLGVHAEPPLGALYFENPRNTFRTGPAFVAISGAIDHVVTERGRFFGEGRDLAHPYAVEHGTPDRQITRDGRPIASFLTTIDIPAQGESTVVVLLGQADDRVRAEAAIRKYRDTESAFAGLEETRSWWSGLMDTLRVQTRSQEFDRYLDWLKYQALAERIWARRGFYQASGAYGFRDQLQDSVNLMWMDPAVARRQILLHASQQFTEGDVVHWFHRLQDGRTGFVGRTHASDNLLWLPWAVVEYVAATGDETLLDERTPYLEAEQPFEPLPAGKHGMGFDPFRSTRSDTVYRHCLKAIDLVLEKRMGVHGLPLMGTGDWNDGLDEIGSQGRGESVWLGFFLSYILERMAGVVGKREGDERREFYVRRLQSLKDSLELTWRNDRYLRAIHDDGTEIGVEGSGVWEIDALTAAWAVMSGINPGRGRVVFETALSILEKENTILLGWPPLREDTKPYLGRSSWYPEGVRENGMYCHGVQWLVGAARILAEQSRHEDRPEEARQYVETAYRLWLKISPIPHTMAGEIETYGGQPNKQAADMVTTFDPGRMIWNGYTGAAGWMFRQALEGVLGLRLAGGRIVTPTDLEPAGELAAFRVSRDLSKSPLRGPADVRSGLQEIVSEQTTGPGGRPQT